MHAAALGVDVVHAAVTGRSAIIVDGGEIAEQTQLVEPAVLIGTVRLRDEGLTPYARLGDWLQMVAVAALVVTVVNHSRARTADRLVLL